MYKNEKRPNYFKLCYSLYGILFNSYGFGVFGWGVILLKNMYIYSKNKKFRARLWYVSKEGLRFVIEEKNGLKWKSLSIDSLSKQDAIKYLNEINELSGI